MKREDLKAMADQCRRIAEVADIFTKRRLLDLALQYDACTEGQTPASRQLGSLALHNHGHSHYEKHAGKSG